LKFKAEVCLLLTAIVLFVVSTFIYSWQVSFSWGLSFPYRGYAFTFLGFGSVLMAAASISYSKRSKNLYS
jgi:uncharacterized membrane protein